MSSTALMLDLPTDINSTVRLALSEDVGSGDVTATLIPASRICSARVVCREPSVLAGAPWFDSVFRHIDPAVTVTWQFADGAALAADDVVCRLHGPARAIVTGLDRGADERGAFRSLRSAARSSACSSLDSRSTAHAASIS